MPMYTAFAPFFKGDKGDRRVTAFQGHQTAVIDLKHAVCLQILSRI